MARPMTRLAVAGLAGHVFFELGAGVGMPLASVAGDTVFALVDAAGLAAVLGHLAAWPRRPTRLGLPVLQDCEGLGPELMRHYNPIVLGSGAAALAGLVAENRSAPRLPALLVLASTPLVVATQRAEYRRLRGIAHRSPAWWNRRLATAAAAEHRPATRSTPTLRPMPGPGLPASGEGRTGT